ncbi:uncharacterized protein A1O9_04427 [Exophiala aquamarina CBS 119918]|uniref:Uncharacterized protein n=1 Tax=Exophiala aquamarina CBS 119918 TaxID=1182545 RepID=A0A072PIK2_9EURO|nr:uncharacterized protein A1O9_04427 [Exophiala aquamarina CBS 119918]KEF59582.1 hypothetical protein A1O9_04427 [Exophiala aquamarina CBS 119918]
MAAIHQTIAIVDKSNKVVSTSKQLKNVFKEAKLAYLERKAEIVADRKAREERELRKAIKAVSIAEDAPSDTSRRSRRHHSYRPDSDDRHRTSGREGHHHHHHSESRRRSHSHEDSCSAPSASPTERPPAYSGLAQFNEDLYGTHRSAPASPDAPRGHGLVRCTTDLPLERYHSNRPAPARAHSTSDMDGHIDMDLAYGEFHPESLRLSPKVEQQLQKQEMSSLVEKCKLLMDEANCAQHSVRAIVAHLQKNPDAMAAVALTLAEISNLATKMAPAALMSFKTAAPAVFAVLAAPEFLIAVGVGVGLTVVMFGGYKIIKKIKLGAGDKDQEIVDEMLDVNELSRIEHWRRGISDTSDTVSVATSVEGEFITPMAAASMGHLPLPRERSEVRHGERKREGKKKHKHRNEDEDAGRTVMGSESSTRSKKSNSRSEKRDKALVKVKKPSPLRRMFTSKSSDTSSRH